MPLKTFVKASTITNLSDARFFSAFPVQWMSFPCNPISKQYIPPQQIQELIGWLQGPNYCLEVAGLSPDAIASLLQEVEVQGIEVEGIEELAEELNADYTIFRRVYINKNTTKEELAQLLEAKPKTDYFIFDFQLNEISFTRLVAEEIKITKADIELLAKQQAVLLAIDIEANQIEQFLTWKVSGIDVQGGEEEKVGLRSFDDIQDIMEELDQWD